MRKFERNLVVFGEKVTKKCQILRVKNQFFEGICGGLKKSALEENFEPQKNGSSVSKSENLTENALENPQPVKIKWVHFRGGIGGQKRSIFGV